MTQRGKDILLFSIGLVVALAGLGIEHFGVSGGKTAYLYTIGGVLLVIAGSTMTLNRAFALAFRRRADEREVEQSTLNNPTTTDRH